MPHSLNLWKTIMKEVLHVLKPNIAHFTCRCTREVPTSKWEAEQGSFYLRQWWCMEQCCLLCYWWWQGQLLAVVVVISKTFRRQDWELLSWLTISPSHKIQWGVWALTPSGNQEYSYNSSSLHSFATSLYISLTQFPHFVKCKILFACLRRGLGGLAITEFH